MEIQRGFRDKLNKYVNVNEAVEIEMLMSGGSVYDYCCFGVDADNKLSDDRYMVFFNQTSSPNGEIVYSEISGGAVFRTELSKLPAGIEKLVLTVSIDGNGKMGDIASHTLVIRQNGNAAVSMNLTGSDFQNEKAIISVEIYRKDDWRLAAVARGFDGGLSELLKAYGGEEAAPEAPAAPEAVKAPAPPVIPAAPAAQAAPAAVKAPAPEAPKTPKISLEKKLQKSAPKLVSLAKPLMLELEKRDLTDCVARVALVLDMSGSMTMRYRNGTVQEIVNKALPLAVQFDDDGELDFWYYGKIPRRMPSVNMKNYKNAVPRDWERLMDSLGILNNEPPVMNEVLREYKNSRLPAYVIFISDGGVKSEAEIKSVLMDASQYPIFWQFVGVGGTDYGILERLDNMSGRYVDNASFFALDDFMKVSNEELYQRLLSEFPQWLREAKSKGIL